MHKNVKFGLNIGFLRNFMYQNIGSSQTEPEYSSGIIC
jgi:hypothetical protein